jgi:hypothetical protein
MPQVFLSYAREDRERARTVASALEAQGWSVWWDRKIVAGEAFDRTIEAQLESASAVVVLWSIHSVRSEWVLNEAATASEREVLVAALLDEVRQPLEFRRRHAANLTTWNGDVLDAEFQTLLQGLTAKLTPPPCVADVQRLPEVGPQSGRPLATAPTNGRHQMPRRLGYDSLWNWRAGIAAAVALLALTLWILGRAKGPRETGGVEQTELQSPAGNATRSPASAPTTAAEASPPLKLRALDLTSNIGRSADNPVSVTLNTIAKIRLYAGEEYYLRLPAPRREIEIVMDTRLVENEKSTLISSLSVLDESGGVIGDSVIGFNLIDRDARKTASYLSREALRFGFKLVNGKQPADFWVTIRPIGARDLVPFFAEIVPQALRTDQAYTGQLAANERAYYQTTLSRGAYQAVLELARQPRESSNIIGSLVMSDSAGGSATSLIGFNDINFSFRRSARFLVNKDGPIILSVQNGSGIAAYTLRVQAASSQSQ